MSRNQFGRIVLIAVVLGGAFLAQRMGLIDQATFNQLTGNQSQSYSNGNQQSSQAGSSAGLSGGSIPEDRNNICASNLTTSGPKDQALYAFAKNLGLSYPETFVRVSNHINQTGRLPDCYMRKGEARKLGWSGGPLWGYADGRAIGGDRFGNRERRLPQKYNNYIEADLDYDGRRRGADRLLFVKGSKGQWLQWVTVNHYDSFSQVPQ